MNNMNNNNIIEPFKNMLKRINREFADLTKLYDDVAYDDDNPTPSFNQNRFKITVKPDNNTLSFTFDDNYPFRAPKLSINGIDSYRCYRTHDPIILSEYNRLFGKKCMCCETILCPANWGPMYRIEKVIDEYKINKRVKRYLCCYKWLLKINEEHDFVLPIEIIEYIRDKLLGLEGLSLKNT